jgi:DNA topoisomerase-1
MSDDSDFEDEPIIKLASSKRKSIKEESDHDSDEDFVMKDDETKKAKTPDAVTSSTKPKKKRVKLEEDDNSDDDFKVKKKKKKVKIKKATKSEVKKEGKTKSTPTPKALKKMERAERITHAMQAFLWWDAPDPPKGYQWATMEHAGVSFTDPYQPHGVKMLYDGQPLDLSPVEEEA